MSRKFANTLLNFLVELAQAEIRILINNFIGDEASPNTFKGRYNILAAYRMLRLGSLEKTQGVFKYWGENFFRVTSDIL